MTKEDLIYMINTGSTGELKPLKDFKTDKDIKANENYLCGYTEAEWKLKYPRIKSSKIFFSPNVACLGALYFDRRKYVMFTLNLYGRDLLGPGKPETDDEFQERVISTARRIAVAGAIRDYSTCLAYVPSPYAVDMVRLIIQNEQSSPELYEFVMQEYKRIDYGGSTITPAEWEKVMKGKSKQQELETIAASEAVGKSKITIYRGESDLSTPYTAAYSWTTDINVAMFFAARFGNKMHRIVKASVREENIAEYFSDDSEQEILVIPGNIESNVKITNLFAVSSVGAIKDMAGFNSYKHDIKELYGPESGEHDGSHTMRVLFNAIMILEKSDLRFTRQEKNCLYTAITYHDVGRIGDGADNTHGDRSAEMYLKDNPEDSAQTRIVSACIRLHDIDDEQADKKLAMLLPGDSEQTTAKRVLSVLKDADALDRVRFGIKALDIKYLRHRTSVKLVPVAVAAVEQLKY